MKFDEQDLQDARVLRSLPGWHAYPHDVDSAPVTPGVYILADDQEDILYIGATSEDGLRVETMTHIGAATDRDAVKFRWIITRDLGAAQELMLEWVRKYKPRNLQVVVR